LYLSFGSPGPVRTADPGVNSALLYLLSYWGSVLIIYIIIQLLSTFFS
jgi:hypothetical protein